MAIPSAQRRLNYIDNLRIALIILVVLHHAGQAYGPGGWWYFEAPERASALGIFFTLNRSFFMSLFFFLSGLFLPDSLERKGALRYLKDRLLRLGVPILFFFFLAIPLLTYIYYLNFRDYGWISFFDYYGGIYFGGSGPPPDWTGPTWPDMQFGHLWFVQHLLIYSLGYLGYRMLEKRLQSGSIVRRGMPKTRVVALFVLCLAIITLVVRIWYPVDRWSAFLGFIQVMWADVPRDLSFFVLGILAGRKRWLDQISRHAGFRLLGLGIALAVFFTVVTSLRLPVLWGGPGDWRYVFFCVWESLFCLSVCIGLAVLFREKIDHATAWLRVLANATFGVYLFHVPVVVGFQYLFGPSNLAPLAAFALVSLCAVPLSFALIALLRRIPGVCRIL